MTIRERTPAEATGRGLLAGLRAGGRPGSPERIDEVALHEDRDHDRDEDPELGLDHRRDRGQDRRPLGVVPPQFADAEEQEDQAEGIDLGPDRAVEPGDRVDDEQERAQERRPARAAELHDELVDEVPDRDIREDRRQLDQVADAAEGVADDPDQPQDIEVAGGVIDE